jgi:hypothetical protein
MRVFISKYELRMTAIKEHQFHDKDNTQLQTRKQVCDITKMYVTKIRIILLY